MLNSQNPLRITPLCQAAPLGTQLPLWQSLLFLLLIPSLALLCLRVNKMLLPVQPPTNEPRKQPEDASSP